jgi:hypothetical protein
MVLVLRSALLVLLLLGGSWACGAGWRRVEDVTPRAFPTRVQVQVWQGHDFTLLHGVRLDRDTLSGVPFTQVPTCDSCRVEFALSEVDSLRQGNKERGFFRTAAVFAAIGLATAYLFSGVGD